MVEQLFEGDRRPGVAGSPCRHRRGPVEVEAVFVDEHATTAWSIDLAIDHEISGVSASTGSPVTSPQASVRSP